MERGRRSPTRTDPRTPPGPAPRTPVTDGGVHDANEAAARRVVVLNPVSGDGSHVEPVQELAAEYGYAVYESEREGHTLELTMEAIEDGAETIVACGGDGTVNEVVRGIHETDAYDDVTLGVLPGGTGNDIAGNIGIETFEDGFEALEDERIRTVDVGLAGDRPFVNSCIGGITAEASSETTPSLKSEFGVLAYVLTTLRSLTDYDGFDLALTDPDGEGLLWSGTAVCVIIGNARHVGPERLVPADMEDGLLDVTIVEAMPPAELLQTAAVYRLFGDDRDAITHLQTRSLEITVTDVETPAFSLDGEILKTGHLDVTVAASVLSLAVGDSYEPHPGWLHRSD